MDNIEIDFEIKKEQIQGMTADELQSQLKDAITNTVLARLSDSIENGEYVSIEPNSDDGYDISLSISVINKNEIQKAIQMVVDRITECCYSTTELIQYILAPMSFDQSEIAKERPIIFTEMRGMADRTNKGEEDGTPE